MAAKYSFQSKLDKWVDLFFRGLEAEPKFMDDTIWHNKAVQELNKRVFERLDELELKELKEYITDNVMMEKPNHKKAVLGEIDSNFNKAKRYLEFIKAFDGKPKDMDRLLDRSDNLHIKGAGLAFITQLLAGAHLNEYISFQDNIYEALQDLGIINIGPRIDTGSQYMSINAVCNWLYEAKFEKTLMLKGYNFGLQIVHNFLWHYHYHQIKGHGRWWTKD